MDNLNIPTTQFTPTLPDPPTSTQSPPISDQKPQVDPEKKKLWDQLQNGVSVCKIYRRKLIQLWTTSIDYRRGKPFASQSDEDRISVNLDWPLTKAKQASLFSQVPQIRIDHPPESQSAGTWLSLFEQRLNDTFVVAGIESAMDECLPDVINAAGIGAILVAHEAISEDVDVPVMDPATLQGGQLSDGSPAPTMTIPRIHDHRYTTARISPADLLWPINFTGSDFDNAPWIGRSGRISWPQAMNRFKLQESDKESVLGEDRTSMDRLTHDIDKDKVTSDDLVCFDELFYKEFEYDPSAKSFSTIHHIVFIQGKEEPVIDEPWKGQKLDPTTNQILGAQKSPLRILTLTYITDETIPPSDSAIGRPQVNEINKSRTQMMLQRDRNIPIRWADVNRIDPTILQSLMRGTWQTIIPVQGAGTNIIGEVAKSSMPQEDFTFNAVARADLDNTWQIGPNQEGSAAGVDTAAESNNLQSNFQTRISQERARIAKFIVGIGEVLGGLICLNEDPASFGQGFDPSICRTLDYSILADSTVLLDSNQRMKKLTEFLNLTAKSGWVNVEPVLKEMASLAGLDPTVVIQPPLPRLPEMPNISLRLTGVEDMMNPLALAFMIKSGQAPPPELIEQAKQLIQSAVTPPANPEPGTPPVMPGPGAPNIVTEQLKGSAPGVPPISPATQLPSPPPLPVGDANPKWATMSKLNKRTEGGKD